MARRTIAVNTVALVASLLLLDLALSHAQVTFSRDWNAGKRGVSECSFPMKSAGGICQMLMTEMRAMVGCEVRSLLQREEEQQPPEVFIGGGHPGRR